jgi:hypothetical protein
MDTYLPAPPEVIDLNDPHAGFTDAEKLAALTVKYEELQTQLNQNYGLTLNAQTALRRLTDNVDHFERALKGAIDDEAIDSDLAKEFAGIFDIQLGKMYEFTVNVEYTFGVIVPMNTDPDDIIDNLRFIVESDCYYGYYSQGIEIYDEDVNVTHSDYKEV